MPSPAGVAPTNTTPGGAHPIGTAAGPLRPPRVERLVFRCEPSTAGVVWLIAAPAFSLSRECRPTCHADYFDAVSLPSDRSLPIRYPEVRPACNSIRTGTRSCLAVLQRRGRSWRARSGETGDRCGSVNVRFAPKATEVLRAAN